MKPSLRADHYRRRTNTSLASVKKALARRLAAEFEEILSPALIRRALDDAHELAKSTGFPQLTFPLLAEENVRRVSAFLRQDTIEQQRVAA